MQVAVIPDVLEHSPGFQVAWLASFQPSVPVGQSLQGG